MKRLLPILMLLGCPEPSEEGMNPPPDMGAGQPPGGAPPGEGATPPPGDGTAPPPGAGDGTTGVIPALTVNPGEGVKLSGNVTVEGNAPGTLRLDLGVASEEGAGQKIIHAVTLEKPGPWEIEVPKDLGQVNVTLFLDVNGDGPSPNEPTAVITNVTVGSTPVTGLDATLKGTTDAAPPADGTAPAGAPPAGAPPTDGTAPAGAPPAGAPPAGEAPPAGTAPAGQ